MIALKSTLAVCITMLLINAGYAQLSIPADFSNDSMVCSKQECVEISFWQITLIDNVLN